MSADRQSLEGSLEELLAEIDPATRQYLDQLLVEDVPAVRKIVQSVLYEPVPGPSQPKTPCQQRKG